MLEEIVLLVEIHEFIVRDVDISIFPAIMTELEVILCNTNLKFRHHTLHVDLERIFLSGPWHQIDVQQRSRPTGHYRTCKWQTGINTRAVSDVINKVEELILICDVIRHIMVVGNRKDVVHPDL